MKIGITASAFDLLHSGHVLMLQEARTVCDYLIAAIHVDPSLEHNDKNKPIQSIVERFSQVDAIRYVDKVIPYQTELELIDIIQLYRVDIRVIGEEYRYKNFTGSRMDIETYFNSRKHNFSSSNLREKVANIDISGKPDN
tara:strand:+ start:9548 stop:9967 length:420 start_codon:yes stop_codon:yes gene_type:complete